MARNDCPLGHKIDTSGLKPFGVWFVEQDMKKNKWCLDCRYSKQALCDYPHEMMEKQNGRNGKS